jgi:Fur family iron response transcriptional regulator
MGQAIEPATSDALRAAGLPLRGPLPRLLALLAASPDTHLSLAQIEPMALEAGLALRPVELARCLETLVEHGLLGLLPTTGPERVFDTLPQAHAHVIYEDDQVIDLHVSHETLLAMIADALERRPGAVEVVVRFRR